jgi:hypothetical protein
VETVLAPMVLDGSSCLPTVGLYDRRCCCSLNDRARYCFGQVAARASLSMPTLQITRQQHPQQQLLSCGDSWKTSRRLLGCEIASILPVPMHEARSAFPNQTWALRAQTLFKHSTVRSPAGERLLNGEHKQQLCASRRGACVWA